MTDCRGQGFMKFGTKDTAAVRDYVNTAKAGTFDLTLRYSAVNDINSTALYVNGEKVKNLTLKSTSSYNTWNTVATPVELKDGENKIEIKANSTLPSPLYLDCIQVKGDFGDGTETVEPLNGEYFTDLVVNDKENRGDWSIYSDFNKGSVLFGDRDIKIADLPECLEGAEAIRTACDSKMYEKALGTFTAGADMTLYIATDTRVVNMGLPDWFTQFENTGMQITLDNDLVLAVYSKNLKAGEQFTLGTNGGNGNNVCYIALATKSSIRGDVNADGKFDISDIVLLQKWILGEPDTVLADRRAGDLCEDERIDAFDLVMMKNLLITTK